MKQKQTLIISVFLVFSNVCLAGELQFFINSRYLAMGNVPVELYGISIIRYESECTYNEKSWGCGKAAHEALSEMLKHDSQPVCIDVYKKPAVDKRLLQVECFLGANNLNAKLVMEGWALTATTPGAPYRHEELVAKNNMNGVFRGGFIPPNTWRPNADISSKECGVCTARHRSFRRAKEKPK